MTEPITNPPRTTVSLRGHFIEDSQAKAKAIGKTYSAYITDLIERDLANEPAKTKAPTANDPDLLIKLFEQYQPLLVDDLKEALKANPAKDQKRIIAYTLDGLLDYLMHYYDGTASRLAIMPDKTARDIITAIQQLPPAHELDISEYYGEAELANQAQQDAELVAKEHRDNILHGKPFSHQHTKELAAEDQHPYNKPNHGTEKPA